MHHVLTWLAVGLFVLGLAASAPTTPDLPDPEPQGGGAGDPDG